MKREFSAGGIVFNNQNQVLLIKSSGNHAWQFPKGQIEKGQTSKEAAIREVREEAGVNAQILEKVGDSKYVYPDYETKEKIFKIVTFYLMKYIDGDISDHDFETEETGWYSLEEALKLIKFSDQKKFLQKAWDIWQTS